MVEKGYDFVWRHGEVPYLIHPDDKRHVKLAVQVFCPHLEITGGESPPPPPTRRKTKAKASAAATHARKDSVLNSEAKEFYPAGHVKSVEAKSKRRRGKGARWATQGGHSDATIAAPATVKEGGDAEAEITGNDDEAVPESAIEVGNAVAPVVEDLPLKSDGDRDLTAEAVSLEHMMTHTPFNGHCPSCVRAKMLRKPARRIEHDPAVAPKKFGDLVNSLIDTQTMSIASPS